MQNFEARWSGLLIGLTVFSTVVLLGVGSLMWRVPLPELWAAPIRLVSPVVFVGCLLFTVRGYQLAGRELGIQRLLWVTRVSLEGLESVAADPEAMRRSLRTFGNGGCFSISGRFRNKKLGPYRAWVTDHRNAVVLKFGERTLVVSPSDPAAFVEQVKQQTTLG